MKEVEKENGETFIEDEVTLRLCFPKEWCSMTKGDIQKMLNKYIEDEWRKARHTTKHKDIDDDYVPFMDKCGEQYVPN
jgi:hypothetical protein